jgi:hypothetical protein
LTFVGGVVAVLVSLMTIVVIVFPVEVLAAVVVEKIGSGALTFVTMGTTVVVGEPAEAGIVLSSQSSR